MSTPGRIDQQGDRLQIVGNWVLAHYRDLRDQVRQSARKGGDGTVSLEGLEDLDTAGAALLVELLGAARVEALASEADYLPRERQALLETVARAMGATRPPDTPPWRPIHDFLAGTGERVEALWHQQRMLMGFIGMTLVTILHLLPRPHRWRLTALVAHLHQTGFNAVPIVALLTFLVGAVVAFLGATVLEEFGATIYTVDLVAYSFLREFGVLLAAILLAGRTASAFTAQIGSMKANEEIDAIRTQGLSPMELLVVPRVMAMMFTLPLLTFIGMMSGIMGGAVVCSLSLDIPFNQFFAILERDIPLQHFLVGMAKAPVFAFLIAVIGCLEGFKVSGSAQSVGEHTTSSVVQSIFIVILMDALAALFFMEMGW
ncbi:MULTISPECIES: ABC transporter permease [unclassified Ectothiorhodospira]|uniref:ABC transporter permease n=1 Tax=unclassified Ectothiorhodospira TaxID=2684909 RepID=UPI001EE855D6|nr:MULTISPECIES: MlaE family lipid ABC transporter permease subunit [unclassified Ectothiorhodospira]MCG5514537.1 MlaE family lipid ABC transporter permease subunit [Ectothiorhodospira sp. 9100]MCG5518659.1 MlaE family lipid ABC transporter permease subunit [Ectothiorhodospira sp. 9905]